MDLIAHRGNNGVYFENSKAAVLYSLKQPYIAGVEIDVRYTRDGQFVVIHDNILNRVSNGCGLVTSSTLSELKHLSYGNHSYSFTISTLEELLKEITSPKKILIELKYEGNDYQEYFSHLLPILNRYQYLNLYLCSFNYRLIKAFQKRSRIKCGLIIGYTLNLDHLTDSTFAFQVVHRNHLKKQRANRETFVWMVNEKEDYEALKEDYPTYYFISDCAYQFI